jgi:hypothetical protein
MALINQTEFFRPKAAVKETKAKEKETTFIQRRFRKNKDSQEKRKSQLLEQETTQTENSQTKTTEKTNNIEQENKDFDIPQLNTKSDSTLDSTQSSGTELESSKNSEKKSDSQSLQNSSIQEYDANLSIKADDFQSEIEFKEKRSQSLTSKITARRAPIRRAISNTSQNSYSKLQRDRKQLGEGGGCLLRLKQARPRASSWRPCWWVL